LAKPVKLKAVKAGCRHIFKSGINLNKIVSINLFLKSLAIIRSLRAMLPVYNG
jgi:hypothetical protein